jgi:hypothetical protein
MKFMLIMLRIYLVLKAKNSEVYAIEFSDSSPVHGLMMPNMSPLAFPLVVKETAYVQDFVEDSRPQAAEVRSFFPETWLWEMQYTG